MSIRNQNWYNLQSTRRYPLDDISTGVDDSGAFIRDDILVDCHIRFPSTLGEYLYVQGLTVSAGIVTVVFGVANSVDAASGATVAVVSVPQPVEPYVHVPIRPMVAGISGWVVFGPGVVENFSGRYTTPQQTLVQPRSARKYRPLPIPTMGKLNLAASLQGVVNLLATTPVTATYETIAHDGIDYPAIVFRLDKSEISSAYNPLSLFLGPCGKRPESGTCDKTPIESINGITPDCNGNINIAFDGFNGRNFANCGGIDITTDINLQTICDANKPKRPEQFTDLCCAPTGENISTYPTRAEFPAVGEENRLYNDYSLNQIYRYTNGAYVLTDIVIDEYCWPDPIVDIVVDETVDPADYVCLSTPLCVDFGSCYESVYFDVRRGAFNVKQTLAPGLCDNCGSTALVAEGSSTALSEHNTYAATGVGGQNIALLKNCATDWALGKTVSTEFKIGTGGAARTGGLVLNYKQTLEFNRVVTRYIVVVLDVSRGRVRVLRYTDDTFVNELTVNFAGKVNTWYTMSASLNLNGSALSVSFNVSELAGSGGVSGTVELINPGDVTGASGLFSNQSYTYFNKFTVQ
jgi:hypothetical protein